LSLSLKDGWDRISENYQQRSGMPADDVYWGDNALHPLDKLKIMRISEARQQYKIMKEVPYWVIFKTRKDT